MRVCKACLIWSLLLVACGQPPVGEATPDGAAPPGVVDASSFALTSSAFSEAGVIPTKYHCPLDAGGQNLTPPLRWTPGPAGTRSYALTMSSGGSVQWLLWDIPSSVREIPEGIEAVLYPPVPAGSKQSALPANLVGYYGPCFFNAASVTFTILAESIASIPNLDPQNYVEALPAIRAGAIGTATLSAQR